MNQSIQTWKLHRNTNRGGYCGGYLHSEKMEKKKMRTVDNESEWRRRRWIYAECVVWKGCNESCWSLYYTPGPLNKYNLYIYLYIYWCIIIMKKKGDRKRDKFFYGRWPQWPIGPIGHNRFLKMYWWYRGIAMNNDRLLYMDIGRTASMWVALQPFQFIECV